MGTIFSRRRLSMVVGLLILTQPVAFAQGSGISTDPADARVHGDAGYQTVERFLSTRGAGELSKRPGVMMAPRELTAERVQAVIAHAQEHGHVLELTPERVLAYASLYRQGDSECEMATVIEKVLPLLVPVAIWIGKTVVQEIALEYVFSRITDEPFSWKEVAKSTAISAVTGGLGGAAKRALKFRRLYSHGLTWDTSVGILVSDSLRAAPAATKFAHSFAKEAGKAILQNEIDSRSACLEPLQQYGPLTTTVAVLETWGTDCVADALLETYEAELVEIQQTVPALGADADPVVPLSLAVSDGVHFTPFIPSSGMAEVSFTFMPTATGSVEVEVGAVNGGQEVILDSTVLAVADAQVFSLLEGSFTFTAQELLGAVPGDDGEFEFFVRFTKDGFETSHWGPTDTGVPLYVDGPENTAPITMLNYDATGHTVRFYGSYLDVDGDAATQLLLQIDGPGGRQEVDLRDDLAGANPAAQQDFERYLQVGNGLYSLRLLASDGTHSRVNGDLALRVSGSAPSVQISLDASQAVIGEMVGGTVTVTDALGAVPGSEVSLQTDLRSPFFDAGGRMVREVTTGSNGSAAFYYRPDFSGTHTVLAMEPEEHEFDWTTLSVAGSPSGWTADWSFSRDAAASGESSATYDVQVFIQYQGIDLDPGDYVFFSANHGSFQDDSDQVGESSIATNRYTLTSAEADSGSEVFTIDLPKYDVKLSHVTDLAVGAGAPFVPVRTTNLPGFPGEDRSFAVAYSKDGRYVAYIHDQTSIVIKNLDDLGTVRSVTPDGDDLNCLAFSPDGEKIAAGDQDGNVFIVTVSSGAMTSRSMTNGHADISNIHWYSADRLAIATQGGGNTYTYAPRVLFADAALTGKGSFTRPELTTTEDLYRVTCHAGAGLCAASTGYGEERWYLFTTGGSYLDSRVHPDANAFWALAFNSVGDRLFVGGDDANGATIADLYAVSGSGATEVAGPLVGSSDVDAATFLLENGEELLAVGGRTLLEIFPATGGGVLRSTADPGYLHDEDYYLTFLEGVQQLVAVTNQVQTYYNFCGDHLGPSISLTDPGDLPYQETSVTLQGSAADSSGLKSVAYRVGGAGEWTDLTLDGGGGFSLFLPNLPTGDTLVEVQATDDCLNVSIASVTVTRTPDLQPPSISSPAVDPFRGPSGTIYTVSAQVVDFGAGVASASASVKNLAGATVASLPMSSAGGGVYLATFDSTGHPGGVYLVDLTAVDASPAQNSATVIGAVGIQVCALADALDLSGTTVISPATYRACTVITAGNGFVVGPGGDVRLQAGERVVLGDGFSVEAGGALSITIDPGVGID